VSSVTGTDIDLVESSDSEFSTLGLDCDGNKAKRNKNPDRAAAVAAGAATRDSRLGDAADLVDEYLCLHGRRELWIGRRG
jgi:hypothetical protein